MSSEPRRRPSPQPYPGPRQTEDPGAAELGRVLGYDPDDPATWPGNATDVPAGPAAGPAAVPAPDADEPVKLTDAKAMRAVAHPVRMALIELFGYHETLTATQASELLGESPANCAFHLRTLAKYGFLHEAGGGKGRERPWTLTSRTVTITDDQPDPQAALAANELGRLWFERWVERARRYYGSNDKLPGWEEASGWTNRCVFLTPEETTRLREEMRQLLSSYEGRLADPALRPAGALPVEWTVFAAPIASELAAEDPATRRQD